MSTAVVLSGGGSLGAVQVGMLRALAEAGIVPDVVVGTSVGALNGAFVAGRPWPDGLDEMTQVRCSPRRADVFPATPIGVLRAAAGRSNPVVSDRGLRRLLDSHLTYGRSRTPPCRSPSSRPRSPPGGRSCCRTRPPPTASSPARACPGSCRHSPSTGTPSSSGLVDNIPISVAADLGVDSIIVLPSGYACPLPAPAPPRDALPETDITHASC